jgi:transcriptional regulator with XRE-family HTH domain
MMDLREIGLKIRSLRMNRGLSQRDLAKDLNIANSTISNWENARRLPSIGELKRVADYFGVSLSIFELDDQKQRQDKEKPLSDRNGQSIEVKRIAMRIDKGRHAFFIASLAFLLIASITTDDIALIALILGLFSLSVHLGRVILSRIAFERINRKTYILPADNQVYYKHPETQEEIANKRTFANVLVLLELMMSILFYGLSIIVLIRSDLIGYSIILSIYALVSIMVSFIRYRHVKELDLIVKRIDYFKTFKDLKYRIHLATLVMNMIALVAVVVVLTFMDLGDLWFSYVSVVFGIVLVSADYVIDYRIREHLSAFELFSVDDEGREGLLE